MARIAFSSDNRSFVGYPYFSPVGYFTLFVVKLLRSHPNDDPTRELLLLQHADIHDEDTRSITTHLRSCFPSASWRRILSPKEQASDLTLLILFAAANIMEDFQVPNNLLAQARSDILAYVELLEGVAATATTPNVHTLLATHSELRRARETCFSALFSTASSTGQTTTPASEVSPLPKAQLPAQRKIGLPATQPSTADAGPSLELPPPPAAPHSPPANTGGRIEPVLQDCPTKDAWPPIATVEHVTMETQPATSKPTPTADIDPFVESSTDVRSALAASAAEQRAQEALKRGIGDIEHLQRAQRAREELIASRTADLFGASRAASLRQRIQQSRSTTTATGNPISFPSPVELRIQSSFEPPTKKARANDSATSPIPVDEYGPLSHASGTHGSEPISFLFQQADSDTALPLFSSEVHTTPPSSALVSDAPTEPPTKKPRKGDHVSSTPASPEEQVPLGASPNQEPYTMNSLETLPEPAAQKTGTTSLPSVEAVPAKTQTPHDESSPTGHRDGITAPLHEPSHSSASASSILQPIPEQTPIVERRHTNLCLDPDFDAALILGYDDMPQAFEDNTFCGLQNLGNTCYANALLNALAKIPLCRLWLLQHQQIATHDVTHSSR